MKNRFLLLSIALIIIGCSSDSSSVDSQNPTSLTNKLKKIKETQYGRVIKTIDYEYNNLGNISKLTIKDEYKNYQTTFNYDSSNKMISWNLSEYYLSNPSDLIEQVNSLEYTNSLITNICINRKTNDFGSVSNSIDRISFSYSGLWVNNIKHYIPITDSETSVCSDVTDLGNEEFYEFSNGNLIRYEAPGSSFFDQYYKIEYDNGSNPKFSIKPDAFMRASDFTTVNNKKKISVYDSYNDELTATVLFENTYDKNNNLIKAVEKYYDVGYTSPSVTTTIEYYYY